MAAFDASFLDNPFEAQLTSVDIPEPIAPARPTITPSSGMWNGQAITGMDARGNLYGVGNVYLGAVPGSAAAKDAGSSSTSGTADPNASGRAGSLGIDTSNPAVYQAPTAPTTGIIAQAAAWIKANTENFVFIIIGILLVGAGTLALGFQGIESAVGSVSSGAARVTKTAAKVAELAP